MKQTIPKAPTFVKMGPNCGLRERERERVRERERERERESDMSTHR